LGYSVASAPAGGGASLTAYRVPAAKPPFNSTDSSYDDVTVNAASGSTDKTCLMRSRAARLLNATRIAASPRPVAYAEASVAMS
jgi:hypothetical protein